MAKSTGLGDKLFSHGRDLSGDVGSVQRIETLVSLLEVTGIDSSTVERAQGISDGALEFNAWFNDNGAANRAAGAGSTHVVLSTLPTTNILLMYCRGASLGSVCAALSALQVGYGGQRGADGSLAFSVATQAAAGAPLEYGELVTAGKITHASASTSTGSVAAAATTFGGVGYLQGFSIATGTATVVIQHSSDTTNGVDGTWATLLTFANTSATWPIGERKTVTGTVNKGLRAQTTGTFTNAVFAIGFRRGASGDRESLA